MGLFGPVGSEMASKMTDALFGSTADSKRYVRPMLQIGSIVRVNYGEDLNKLATVVDIIDSGRLLVEGPENLTGVPRKVLTIKRMTLTGLGVGITRNARQKQLNKAGKDAGIQEKWDKSAYAKTLKRRATRAALNDFDRFKVMLARKSKSQKLAGAVRKMRKSAK